MINTQAKPSHGSGCAAAGRPVKGAKLERGCHIRIESSAPELLNI